MKKLIITLGFICGLFFAINNVYAISYGDVKDDNNGNQGYIFVSTGGNQGSQSIGHWTNPDFLQGEKGDKGEQGIQGIAGQNGINGIDGQNGLNAKDGLNGLNGLDGAKGDTGTQGIQGNIGDKGDIGNTGLTGENGKDVDLATVNQLKDTDISLDKKIDLSNISINNQSKTISDHTNRLNDHENRLNDLERTQYVVEGGARLIDTKKYEVVSFIRYNQTRNIIDTVGVRLTIKLGASYEETLIAKQNNRLAELERKISQAYTIEKVFDTKGNLKSERISAIK